jgi:hypothetical protein
MNVPSNGETYQAEEEEKSKIFVILLEDWIN